MRRQLLGAIISGALLAGTAAHGAMQAAPPAPPAAPEPKAAQPQVQPKSEAEQGIANTATGAQPGKIRAVSGDQLQLTPYDPKAGVAALKLPPNTPVFRGSQMLSATDKALLPPGTDVNVYFRSGAAQPEVLGITLLEPQQAQQLQAALSGKPQSPPQLFPKAQRQAGTLTQVQPNELVLDPYQQRAGNARVRLEDETRVFQNGALVGRDALEAGSNVRVYFDQRPGEAPLALGVEILSPEDARRIQALEQNR